MGSGCLHHPRCPCFVFLFSCLVLVAGAVASAPPSSSPDAPRDDALPRCPEWCNCTVTDDGNLHFLCTKFDGLCGYLPEPSFNINSFSFTAQSSEAVNFDCLRSFFANEHLETLTFSFNGASVPDDFLASVVHERLEGLQVHGTNLASQEPLRARAMGLKLLELPRCQ